MVPSTYIQSSAPFPGIANFSFWSKNICPPFSPDVTPLDYAFWQYIGVRPCNGAHPNTNALRISVDWEWMVMSRDYVIIKASRLSDTVLKVSSFWMVVIPVITHANI